MSDAGKWVYAMYAAVRADLTALVAKRFWAEVLAVVDLVGVWGDAGAFDAEAVVAVVVVVTGDGV
jgi:hypothetical protein